MVSENSTCVDSFCEQRRYIQYVYLICIFHCHEPIEGLNDCLRCRGLDIGRMISAQNSNGWVPSKGPRCLSGIPEETALLAKNDGTFPNSNSWSQAISPWCTQLVKGMVETRVRTTSATKDWWSAWLVATGVSCFGLWTGGLTVPCRDGMTYLARALLMNSQLAERDSRHHCYEVSNSAKCGSCFAVLSTLQLDTEHQTTHGTVGAFTERKLQSGTQRCRSLEAACELARMPWSCRLLEKDTPTSLPLHVACAKIDAIR